MSAQPQPRMTPEEYLAGAVFAMGGARRLHNLIVINLVAFSTLFLLAVSAMAQTPSADPSEYAARRQRLAEAAGPDALVLLFSPPEAHRNGDVSWPFRQEDNLYYLTGVDEPETILALLPGEGEHREILFARDSDPREEIWNGRIPTHEELAAASGIAEVVSVERFDEFLSAALTGGWWGETTLYRYYRPAGLPRFSKAVEEGRAAVWMLLERRPDSGEPLTPELARAEELRRRFPELSFRDATQVLETMREAKSAAEIEILRRAVAITVEAHQAAMRRTRSAEWEHQLQATVEFVFRDRGGCCPGYGSIVASGERTTTLHYVDNDARIPRDGLLLLDIGAEVGHYTADLTRTWPASGKFSVPQREIYEAVLTAWREGLPLLRPGGSLKAVHLHTLEVLGRELLELGLVTENVQEQVELYFPHGVGHPMGLFVHDVFERTRPLEPGMVVTLEPGLYVRRGDVEASEVFQALEPEDQEKIRRALARYAGIGVRIEDDVLVTEGAPEVLSEGLARTVEQIEAFLTGE